MFRNHHLSNSKVVRRRNSKKKRLAFETLEARHLLAAPGTLDLTYGTGGVSVTTLAAYSTAIALQVDGKAVIASITSTSASSPTELGVTRLLTDGTPDPAFNGSGTKTIPFSASVAIPGDVLVQPDGKIVVISETSENTNKGLIARLQTDGSLDTTFGVAGKVELTLNHGLQLQAASLQPDGKLLLVGSREDSSFNNDAVVIRLLADGTIDDTFGSGGLFVLDVDLSSYASDIVLLADGKIAVAATIRDNASEDLAVFQLQPNGQLDSGFGINGVSKFVTTDNQQANEIALQIDGRLVVVGDTDVPPANTQSDSIVIRFDSNGTVDSSFGLGGLIRFDVNPTPGASDRALSLVIAPDNTIIIGGTYDQFDDGGNRLGAVGYVLRLNSNGTVDSSFGDLGVVYQLVPGGIPSIQLQANGDIVGTFADFLRFGVFAFRLVGGSQPTSARFRDKIENPIFLVNNKGYFGRAVAANDFYRVIGAFDPTISNDPNVFGNPSVYIFDRSDQAIKLVNPTNSTNKDGFGFALDIDDGDTVVSDPIVRSVYRFDAFNGDLLRTINSPSSQLDNQFGYSVAISGDRIVVGAPGDRSDATSSGKAYVFDKNTGALLWTINNPEPGVNKRFGGAVSIFGDMIVVASPNDETGINGKAHLFNLTTKTLVTSLLPFDSEVPKGFGTDVDISDQFVIVGSRSGYAYTYQAHTGHPVRSVFNLNPSAFQGLNSVTRVAVNGSNAVVGAYYGVVENIPAGRATVFDVSSGDILWDFGPANPFPLDFAGEVAISDSSVFVGAFGADQAPRGETNFQGQVYEYNLVDGSLTDVAVQPLPASTPIFSDQTPQFGDAIAATATRFVVAAPLDSQFFFQTGAVYLYDNLTNQLVRKLVNPNEDDFDFFGSSIALTDQYAFVGAGGDPRENGSSGTIYRYSAITGDLIDSFVPPTSPEIFRFGYSFAANSEVLIVANDYTVGNETRSELRVYDLAAHNLLRRMNVPTTTPSTGFETKIVISGNSVVVGGYNEQAAYEFNWRTGALLHTLINPRPASQSSFGSEISVAGGYAVIGSFSSFVDIYNLQTGDLVRQLEINSLSSDGAITDGHVVVTLGTDAVSVYDLISGELLQSINNDRAGIYRSIALAPVFPGTASIGGYDVDATSILTVGSHEFFADRAYFTSYYLTSNSNPTAARLSKNHLAENLPANSLVGFFTAIDPDEADMHHYTLVPGQGDMDNSKFTLVGNQLRLIQSPDFETQREYRVRVRTEDQDKTYIDSYFSIFVNDLNDAPAGADKSITLNEDLPYQLTVADFGLSDSDQPANALLSVRIASRPVSGALRLNGVVVTNGQSITATEIAAGKLTYVPASNTNGNALATFTFQVRDNGGTASGGVNLDPTQNTITFNVTPVNDAPSGANKTITTNEDVPYALIASDFGYSDANDSPPNVFDAIILTALPVRGTLALDGVAVTNGQSISAIDITAGKLVYLSPANASGVGLASFTFRVSDNGGIASGGMDVDPTPNKITFDVTSVNDAPLGVSKAIAFAEDTVYTLKLVDFGFSDSLDSPSNAFAAVRITSLPQNGVLRLNNVDVTINQLITVANINAAKLRFTPAANANGVGYSSFNFQVQDNGGTSSGGVDFDPTPKTISFDVTALNDAPLGTDKSITLTEDSVYSFLTADFGFNDPNDSPSNSLQAVKIATRPTSGTVRLNGTAITNGQIISAADIAAGLFTYTPVTNVSGTGLTSLKFQVIDNGGTANGGVDTDPTPNTIAINITPVNDAPSGANKTITVKEDSSYPFTAADFGFSDASDSPANSFLSLKIVTRPVSGFIRLDGVNVAKWPNRTSCRHRRWQAYLFAQGERQWRRCRNDLIPNH